uniref:Uncharacterized protein n=1 Tax=Cacopsylla melanoneura TaxID=428564 RepID=A0A8D8YQS8_9HEMI
MSVTRYIDSRYIDKVSFICFNFLTKVCFTSVKQTKRVGVLGKEKDQRRRICLTKYPEKLHFLIFSERRKKNENFRSSVNCILGTWKLFAHLKGHKETKGRNSQQEKRSKRMVEEKKSKF